MKRVSRAAAAALLAALVLAAAPSAAAVYGSGVDLAEAVPLPRVVADPAPWLGRTIRVEGLVVEVCEARGCWLELGGGDPPVTLRVKVDDGVIVFPLSARGRRAVVQGVLLRVGTGDYPGSGREGRADGPDRHPAAGTLQLRATGAVIE